MHDGSVHKIPNIEPDPEQGRLALVQRDFSRRARRYMKNCSDTIFPSLTS
jgi:hypothetical protein